MSRSPISVRQDRQIAESIFVYGGGKLAVETAERLARVADGVIVRGKSGAKVAHALRQSGSDIDLIFDPAWYEREPSTQLSLIGADNVEISRQAGLHVAAFLSPSHFVPDGDQAALEKVLEEGHDFCEAVTRNGHRTPSLIVLPVSKYWLTDGLDSLASSVASVSDRIALVCGDRNDPLDSHQAVRGLVHLIDAHPLLSLLRSDLAALGAMACGAEAGAIGTGTSVRHFVQPGLKGGGVPDDKTPSVFVPALWTYVKGSKLGQAASDNGLLRCLCSVCGGKSLTRFADERLVSEAHDHSVESWYRLGQWMLGMPVRKRRNAWRAGCQEAVVAHDELAARSGVLFEAPGQLKAWADCL
ncbi:MAG TPA: hypothetical protein VG318_06955 [Actinomycetota bacterium]|nr:hypothetical protein [Actinomycetota bacterium]